MAIIIERLDEVTDKEPNTYRIRLNGNILATFKHWHKHGMANCLLAAAEALARTDYASMGPDKCYGNTWWLADDVDSPMESWDTPITDRWDRPGRVYEVQPGYIFQRNVYVAEHVLTVDGDGDPDETEARWHHDEHTANDAYEISLRAARRAAGLPEDTE